VAVEMFRKWAASVKRPRPLFICSREKSLGPASVDEQSSGKTTRYGNSLPKKYGDILDMVNVG